MENFESYLDELCSGDFNIDKNRLYQEIVELNVKDLEWKEFEDLARKVYILLETKRIDKDLLFVSLVLNKDLLGLFIKYEELVVKLNLNDPSSILNFSYFTKKHWFLEILDNLDDHVINLSDDVKANVIALKIIYILESKNINLDELENYLKLNFKVDDILIQTTIENLRNKFDCIKFIKNIQPNISVFDLHKNSVHLNVLETFSKYLDLKNRKLWPEILFRLENQEKNTLDIFISFTILITIIQTIDNFKKSKNERNFKEELNHLLETTKQNVINIQNKSLQLELLEDIFTLIFGRSEYFLIKDFGEFYCSDQPIKLILNYLKNILDDLKKSYTYQDDFSRFIQLQRTITDAYWRYNLVMEVRSHKKDPKSVMKYMLAKPEALVNICLKRDDLERANQVIQVFNLQKSRLAHEINYSRYISTLKRDIRNIDKQSLSLSKDEVNLQLQKAIERQQSSSQRKSLEKQEPLELGNQIDIDLLDILINTPLKYETYKCLSSQLQDSFNNSLPALSKIYDKIQDVTEKNYIPVDELYSSYKTYDVRKYFNILKQYGKLEKAYGEFKELYEQDKEGTLNLNHVLNEKLLEIQDICVAFKIDERKDYTLYIQKLLNYLREFAKILFSENNNSDLVSKGKDVSVFEILKHKKADITCNLLYNRNLDGAEFDDLFCKLKLDLPYHITYISFPQITFDIHGNIESSSTLRLQKPRQDVINYVQRRSWFLAFLLNNIHNLNDTKIERNEIRVKVFMNLMNLPDIQSLKKLFNNNETLTILHQDYSFFLKNYFEGLLLTDESSVLYDEGYIKLNLPKETTWKSLYELVLTIPEKDKHEDIDNLRDILLCNLIKERSEENYWVYVRYIGNDELRMKIILEELRFWPGEFCVDVLKSQISKCQHQDEVEKLVLRYKQLEIYIKIKELCNYSSWFEVDELCANNPESIMMSILNTTDLDALMDFFQLHSSREDLLQNITEQHLLNYFNKYSFYKIRQLLDVLPKRHCINISIKLFSLLKNLENLNFIVNYLLGINEFDVSLKNIQISSRILQKFLPEEIEQSWCLIEQPLSILEMLLMNTRLEKFGEVYSNIQHDIENTEFDESAISIEKIDELLRDYAEKSLDFKVVGRTPPSGSTESKLMLSIDSICLEPKKFTIPEKVPDKSKWIPDNEIDECMCCRHTKFSMFNRRHHCRRCGRVICWSCSTKRMIVESYGDVLVRVCNDCFDQTQKNEGVSNCKTITEEYWVLNGYLEHDSLVRQEFAYENAPSVMLCLSILKYHSKSEEYPRFLLNQCENILTILRPHKYKRSEEIDYNLIIKMLKALAIAAKVMSNQCMFQWGASLADKIMSQAEMLGLLAENRYLDLLPPPSKTQSSHLNQSVLRSVRDKLLELEQWNLALEVSTKAGLDTTGIFAMWGKSFLQAGNLQLARQKFKMCFEKNSHFDLDRLSLSESQSLRSNRSFYRSLTDNKKILKDPLLLTEIIQILESKVDRINPKLYKQLSASRSMYESTSSLGSVSTITNATVRNEEAICIMNDLLNLEAIEQGNYAPSNITIDENCEYYKPHLENIFYEECVYYLNKYGSPISLCQFYVRHKDFTEALLFIQKNNLNSDIFIEIYIDCLKEGVIELFHNAVVKIDPSFDIWKEYIKSLCIYMEKQSMFNSLYQLQQFIGDFVRAALTCIKFYSSDVTTFSELSTKNEFLYKAQDHLKQVLEQEQWVDVKISSYSSFLEEKPITNAALVMKLDHKSLNLHINTIDKQVEIVNYLAQRENAGEDIWRCLNELMEDFEGESKLIQVPTLFGKGIEKVLVAIVCIVVSDDISIGFNISQSIIKDFKIKPSKVFPQVGKLLAKSKKLDAIRDLVKYIYKNYESEPTMINVCDEMLVLTAKTLAQFNASDGEIETTIKFISNHNIKINTYIETKQLRSGFLLAAKHNKTCDVIRICREAELLNRQDVIKLCEKYLESHPHPTLK